MVHRQKPPNVPVLFVLIGWARRYDGTEPIIGYHAYLADHPHDNAEVQAFVRQPDGYFYCGAGRGEVHEDCLDVVFVAFDHSTGSHRLVGIYRNAQATVSDT